MKKIDRLLLILLLSIPGICFLATIIQNFRYDSFEYSLSLSTIIGIVVVIVYAYIAYRIVKSFDRKFDKNKNLD